MKKRTKMLAAGIMLMLTLVSCDDKLIPIEQVPEAAHTYVRKNYPGKRIIIAKKDRELFNTTYDATLDNGLKLTFDSKGSFVNIKRQAK